MEAYFDNGDSTPLLPEVVEAMLPYFTEKYGNPASLHRLGLEAETTLDEARESIATNLGAKTEEIYFTSGATESNNLVLNGLLPQHPEKKHIIVSSIEHASIRNIVRRFEKDGLADITYLDVDQEGFVDAESLRAAIRDDTLLVSIIHSNNEIGVIQDLATLGEICRERGVLFHSDMAQSLGKLPIRLNELPLDLASFNVHKAHGPKGVGALYMRRKVKLRRLFEGSPQEQGIRPGTENVPGIVGFAKAVEIVSRDREKAMQHVEKLTRRLFDGLIQIPHIRLNGPAIGAKRLPGNLNLTFSYIEGEAILMSLNMEGVYVSSGSACSSRSLTPSHVLTSIGLVHEEAHGSIRFTLSRLNTAEEVDYVLAVTVRAVERLRAMTAFIPEKHSKRVSESAETFYRKKADD